MSESDRYIKAWGDRRARLFMLGAMVAGFWVSVQFLQSPWIAGLCFVGAMIGAYGYHEFRCPRCGERFWSYPDGGLNFGRRCRSCGLEKNAVPPEAAVESQSPEGLQ
ncbi:MAG: hypothetical protein JWQ58_2641 [Reyranella sp.]|nr:hypothetical protein [Reyranella sp.]